MDGDRLPGGWMRGARLVAGAVHRRHGANSAFVHGLLRWLEEAGFDGSPRFLGVEGDDEVLTYIDGVVPVEGSPGDIPDWVWGDEALASAFRLIRRHHDLTATCPLTAGGEVVCHGDLSPWNTVYRDGRAVAFIDWDAARPGPRRSDLGYSLWRFLRLGFPDGPGPEEAVHQLAVACDAYGLESRVGLLGAIAEEQDRQRDWFLARQQAGDDDVLRVIEHGALAYIDNARLWLREHQEALGAALR